MRSASNGLSASRAIGDSAIVLGGTVRATTDPTVPFVRFQSCLAYRAATAPQVKPSLSWSRVGPSDRIRQESLVGRIPVVTKRLSHLDVGHQFIEELVAIGHSLSQLGFNMLGERHQDSNRTRCFHKIAAFALRITSCSDPALCMAKNRKKAEPVYRAENAELAREQGCDEIK